MVAAACGFWPASPGGTGGLSAELVYNAPRRAREGGRTDHVVLVGLAAHGRLGDGHRWRIGVHNLLDTRWRIPVGDEFRQLTLARDGRRVLVELVYEN